ncbi:MAG: hypothetical protein JWM76_1275 [Pseudonocardiales bacterium]|jgi:hypothetical protein|nr:hypothetical protein [Pseudonocardiales bacterium]
MSVRPRMVFVTLPVDRSAVIHLGGAFDDLTVCGQAPALTAGPLPTAKSGWPDKPKCQTCFQALPLASPSRLRLP